VCVVAAIACLVVGRFVPMGGRLGWIGAVTSPFVAQAAMALALAVVVAAALRAWRVALTALLACAWASTQVFAAYFAGRSDGLVVREGIPIRVVAANVLVGNPPASAAVEWFRSIDADVVVLVECSTAWSRAFAELRAEYPYAFDRSADSVVGIAIFSRHPLVETVEVRSPNGLLPALEATVEIDGAPIRFLGVHPPPPATPWFTDARNEDMRFFAERVRTSPTPLRIVAGDWNETPFGAAYREFTASSGLLRASGGFGFLTTWPDRVGTVSVPSLLGIQIDHCFVDPTIAVLGCAVGPSIGSDHRPLVVDLVVPAALSESLPR
jgi:endonuclease/exonuclease/phosphatase (EEP) superfamily protein YafD